jgi:hypothetical protein
MLYSQVNRKQCQPAATATDTLGEVSAGDWYGLNVTSLVQNALSSGDKLITLRLSASNQNSGGYASKEFIWAANTLPF